MRHSILPNLIAALCLAITGCDSNPNGMGSDSDQQQGKVYLSQLSHSSDLQTFEDLAEEFTFECSDNISRKGNSKNKDKDKNKDKNNQNDHSGLCAIVCHAPPGNPNKQITIMIGLSAVDAHLTHGPGEISLDYLGPCDNGNNENPDNENPDDDIPPDNNGPNDGPNDETPDDQTPPDDNGPNDETPDDPPPPQDPDV